MFPLALLNASAPAVDPNLVLLMHFDNNFTDESTYNRTFTTASGTPVFSTDTELNFGSHSYFSGEAYSVKSAIQCSNDAGIDVVSGLKSWQIDFWIKVGGGNNDAVIIKKNLNDNNYTTNSRTSRAWGFETYVSGSNVQIKFVYKNTADIVVTLDTAAPQFLTNTWTHCRAVSNGTSIKLFVSGVSNGAVAISAGGIKSSVYNFYVCSQDGPISDGYFIGKIDELRIASGFETFDDFTPPISPFTY